MDLKHMEIESYVLNFKAKHSTVLKQKLLELHEEESAQQLQTFYPQFLRDCRDYLHSKLKTPSKRILDEDLQELAKVNFYLTELSYKVVKDQMKQFPLAFLEDIYDSLSLAELTDFFSNIQSQIAILQQFLEQDKFVLLKICNAMLKRLSTTHETELRGQIHIFLTQIFSTIHKSGTRKQFNFRDRGFEEEKVPNNTELPYSHYKNFWTLQKYLNNPEQILKNKVEIEEHEDGNEQIKIKNLQAICKVIHRTILYFKENPIEKCARPVKRFPKFLTKYSLFKSQLNDNSFRKVFLIQVYLFIYILDLENYNKEEKQQIFHLKQEVQKQLENDQVQRMIETERIWPLWVKETVVNGNERVSAKVNEKSQQKKMELSRRIFDDLKFQSTTHFKDIIELRKEYKIDTQAIEPGLNYYLNEVLYQLDVNRKISDTERCKNMKDYAWKSVRVICKFFLRELKITNLITSDFKPLPNLEELVEMLQKAGSELLNERQPALRPVIIQ